MNERWSVIRRWLWRGLKFAAVAAAMGAVVYSIKFSPVPVTPYRVERGEIVGEVMGTGTLEARVKATISPKISGRISQVFVDQGDQVSAGKRLVKLDDDELKQQVEIARASLAAAQAALARLKSDKDRVVAILIQAKQHYARCQSLAAEDALTQDELDKANEALAVAQAGVGNSEAAITEGQKQLIVAEKTLRYHQTRLADTEICAPFNGLIVRRQRDPGDVVVPGSAVLTLVSTDELWISAWVDETEMAKVRPGQSARVVFRSEPKRFYTGKVYRLGRETDRETREFVVDVQVLELPTNWAVGQRAEVYIETGRKQATLLRPEYVTWREGRAGVFVNVGQRAVWRALKLGMRGRDLVEALGGLKPGDLAIKPADPAAKLTEGRRVTAR